MMAAWLKRGRAEAAAESEAKRSRKTTETQDFRPHQEEGFGALREAHNSNDPGRVLLDWKTAAGKTFFICRCVVWLLLQKRRVVVVTSHVDLRRAFFDEIQSLVKDKGLSLADCVCEVGAGAAACKIPIEECLVVLSCLKSFKQGNRSVKLTPETTLFVDEAHEFDFYKDRYNETKGLPLICFCSGTPRYDRLPSVAKGKLLVHSYSYKQGLDGGHLKHLRLHRSGVSCDLDLANHILGRIREAKTKRVLVFCPTVNDTQNHRSCRSVTEGIAERLRSTGHEARVEYVEGGMNPQEKNERRVWISEPVKDAPDPRILVVCRTFSQGTDMVPVDHEIFLSERDSVNAAQSMGRGLRYIPDLCHTKTCLVEIMVCGGGHHIEQRCLEYMASVDEINKDTVTFDFNTSEDDLQRLEVHIRGAEAYVAKLPELQALQKRKGDAMEDDKRRFDSRPRAGRISRNPSSHFTKTPTTTDVPFGRASSSKRRSDQEQKHQGLRLEGRPQQALHKKGRI